MDEEEQRLEKLLAQGYLSGSQYDEIERRVMKRIAKPRVVVTQRWAVVAAVAGSLIAAVLLLRTHQQASFGSKGVEAHALGAFYAACRPMSRVCKPGDTLMLSVNTQIISGHIGAYAERVDDATRMRIWYFPGPNGATPQVPKTGGTVVVQQGVRIGPEHAPGRYRIHAWATPQPLSNRERQSVQAELLQGSSVLEIDVTP